MEGRVVALAVADDNLGGEPNSLECADLAEADLASVRVFDEPRVEAGQGAAGHAEIPAAFDAAQRGDKDVDRLAAAIQRLGPEIDQGRETPYRAASKEAATG